MNMLEKYQNEELSKLGKLFERGIEELSKYINALEDMEVDRLFFESLETFVKAEAAYIKTNKI